MNKDSNDRDRRPYSRQRVVSTSVWSQPATWLCIVGIAAAVVVVAWLSASEPDKEKTGWKPMPPSIEAVHVG